jgi:hypothetical protein
MKETTRIPEASVESCTSQAFQYTLLQPHLYAYTVDDWKGDTHSCEGAFPDEWSRPSGRCPQYKLTNNPRFTCITNHRFGSMGSSLQTALNAYTPGTYGTITINGMYYNGGGSLGGGATYFGSQDIFSDQVNGTYEDRTIYRNYAFHTIPSLLKHVSPTPSELDAAENNGATPGLPIDIIRSVEFLTPRGAKAKFTYPNLFDAPTESVQSVRDWLKNISLTEWNAILAKESSMSNVGPEIALNSALSVSSLPAGPIDWNTLVSDEVIEKVIQAKRWLTPNVTEKYQKLVETSLSYSKKIP